MDKHFAVFYIHGDRAGRQGNRGAENREVFIAGMNAFMTGQSGVQRQFRVKNLTESDWPAGPAATPVKLSWSREPKIDQEAVRVEVLRDPAATVKEAVLPLRVRIRWNPGALDKLDSAAVASGRYELEGPDGRLAKAIELALRFDPSPV